MLIALIGLLGSAATYFIAFPAGTERRPLLFIAILSTHAAVTVIYYKYAGLDVGVDAVRYYLDPHQVSENAPFWPGTILIYKVVAWLRSTFGGTLLEHYLFFQFFGMLGVALLIRIFHEIAADSSRGSVPLQWYALLFLPGLHFWSVAIGKDGIAIAAVSLSIWAMIKPRQRLPWMLVAVAALGAVRPHIAGLLAVTLLLQAGLVSAVKPRYLLMALVAVLPLLGAVIALALFPGLFQTLDPTRIMRYAAMRYEFLATNEDADLAGLIYPFRVLSFMFRPLFVDRAGLFGLLASVENVILLGLFMYIVIRHATLRSLMRSRPEVLFAILFGSLTVLALTLVTFNLGTALRQKYMAVPALLTICTAILLARGAHRAGSDPLCSSQNGYSAIVSRFSRPRH